MSGCFQGDLVGFCRVISIKAEKGEDTKINRDGKSALLSL